MTIRTQATSAPSPGDELAAAIETRRELGPRVEREIVDSFLDRVDRSIGERVDEHLLQHGVVSPPETSRKGGYTLRLAVSLVFGIPLTAVAAAIAGSNGNHGAALVAVIAVLASIAGLNVYYTEAEKSLELERMRLERRSR